MTNSTPPGWYPDPGQPDDGPLQQRWWDGSAWTDHLRPAVPEAWNAATATAFPVQPGYPPAQPPRGRRGRRIAVSVVAGVVVVALAGGFYLLGKDNGGGGAKAAGPAPSASSQPGQNGGGQGGRDGGSGGLGGDSGGLGGGGTGGGSSQGGGGQGQLPQTEPGFATDAASGIDLPVPSGWKGQSGLEGAGVTTGSYACPGAPKQTCVRGGVFSAPAAALKNSGSTAKEAATQDIAGNAKESYGSGGIYGKITSHKELKAQAVKVAGKEGYFVRWKVVTSKGDDGYVESLAFPSPTVNGQLVLVRAGFDINSKAPSLSVLDRIVSGIKAAPASGGGSGRGV